MTIPNSVTAIGECAFRTCSSLTSVEIPNSVTTIGECAFVECSGLESFSGKFASVDHRCLIVDGVLNSVAPGGLTSYTIPNGVTKIGEWVFDYCTSLTSVTIPNSVTTIGECAFAACFGLTSVAIPNSVTSIGDYAFADCSNLIEITSYAVEPPGLSTVCFYSVPATTVNVPNVAVSTYQSTDGWNSFTISALNRSESVTISSAGLATLWLEYDATIPTGAEVYYASSYSASKVKMTKITGNLPRETGVIVKGTAGNYTFDEAGTEGDKVTSMLVGSATAQTFEDANYKYYKLTYSNNDDNFGFYLDNSNGTIVTSAHKAYLQLSKSSLSSAPTRGIGIEWGDEGTTEIESVVEFDTDNSTMYNLQGTPVGNDYKGIVIKNGRKMLNK